MEELLPAYWDMPDHDIRRKRMDEHRKICPSCSEQFHLWRESAELIKSSSLSAMPGPAAPYRPTSERVMNRIYRDESWRVPIPNRIYRISYRTRRVSTLTLSFFLAMMSISLYLALSESKAEEEIAFAPIVPVASAQPSGLTLTSGSVLEGVPIASISDPLLIAFGPVENDPNYWLVLSLLGTVSTLLIMNWLSRIRN
jgi:hypothetical protein